VRVEYNRAGGSRALDARKEVALDVIHPTVWAGDSIVVGCETVGGAIEEEGAVRDGSAVRRHLSDHVPEPEARVGIRGLFALLPLLWLLLLIFC